MKKLLLLPLLLCAARLAAQDVPAAPCHPYKAALGLLANPRVIGLQAEGRFLKSLGLRVAALQVFDYHQRPNEFSAGGLGLLTYYIPVRNPRIEPVLGLGGVIAFVAGALMLIDTDLPGYGIPSALIVTVALASALLFTATTTVALKTRRRKRVAGLDDMVGSIAEIEASADAPDQAWAHLRGETWRVISSTPLQPRQKVRVVARRGLLLEVVPAAADEQGG